MWVGHSCATLLKLPLGNKTIRSKNNIKTQNQRRRTGVSDPHWTSHPAYCTVTATLAVWDNEPLVAVTVML